MLTLKTFFGWKEFGQYSSKHGTHPDVLKVVDVKKKQFEGTQHFASQIEVEMDEVRKAYKRIPGITFNDFFTAITGKVLLIMAEKSGIKNVEGKGIKTIGPVSYRALPIGYHDCKIYNNMAGYGVNIPLKKNIIEIMKEMKPNIVELTRPDLIWMVVNYCRILAYIPPRQAKAMVVEIGKGIDFCVSNIPFSDKYYYINGKKIHKMKFFNNLMNYFNIGSFVITYADKVSYAAGTHKHLKMNGQEYVDLVMTLLQEECEKVKKD